MDNYKNQAKLFKLLIHPTRLAILDILREGEQCVCHLEAVLGLRQAYISQQLMVLRDGGLIEDRRDGRNIFYLTSHPEIYDVIDAMRALNGSEEMSSHKKKNLKPASCPCPKCNLQTNQERTENPPESG